MTTSLPSFVIAKSESERRHDLINKRDSKVRAHHLKEKHSKTITKLREKLGFKEDITVIAWLLEQVEESKDIGKTIYQLLE